MAVAMTGAVVFQAGAITLPADRQVQQIGNAPVGNAPAGSSFEVTDLQAPLAVEQGSEVQVKATITNPTEATDSQRVEFRFDSAVLKSERVPLAAGESATVTFTVDTSGVETGQHFHGVYTRTRGEAAQIRVVDEIQSFGVTNLSAPPNATVGENVTITATVDNPNDFRMEEQIELRFSGDVLATEQVILDANESADVSFTVDTTGLGPGTYIHEIFSEQFGQSALITLESPEPDEPTASVAFSDQESDGTSVTVESVTVSDGGFVVLHDDSLLEGDAVGSVVGVSAYLEPGTSENVTVGLVPDEAFNGTDVSENQTLIAMPHLDTNGNETYDFVTSDGQADGPYTVNGTPVTDSANVTLVNETETPSDEEEAETSTDGGG